MSFTELEKTRSAYIDLAKGFATCLDDVRAITTATEGRIESEKTKNAERIAILKERLEDPDTPTSVRRMAEAETAELEEIVIEATQREREAFAEAVSSADDILHDMAILAQRFGDEFKTAQRELETARGDVLGDKNKDLRGRWLEAEKERFCRMWR